MPAIFAATDPTHESFPLWVLTTSTFSRRKRRTIPATATASNEERIGMGWAGIPASSAFRRISASGRQTTAARCPRRIISPHSRRIRCSCPPKPSDHSVCTMDHFTTRPRSPVPPRRPGRGRRPA